MYAGGKYLCTIIAYSYCLSVLIDLSEVPCRFKKNFS